MPQDPANVISEASPDSDSQNSYDDSWSQNMARQNTELGRNLASVTIADAAERDGAHITWNGSGIVIARKDGKRVLIVGPACTESVLSGAVVSDKMLTKQLLQAGGVPTPAGRLARSAEDTVAAQRDIGGPVVVKPRRGNMGKGVTVNIAAEKELQSAYYRAAGISDDVLVEEYIEGLEYRGHGSPTECVAVFQRLLPGVTGNGKETVAGLVEEKNKVRKLNPNTSTNPIILDDIADAVLARQGFDRESIVPRGEKIIVRDVNGITSGGDSRECLDSAPESVLRATPAAVAAVPGMEWGGTDIIVSRETGKAFVMEVNTYASISGSVFPVYGNPRDTAGEVWRRIEERAIPEGKRNDASPWIADRPLRVCSLVQRDVNTGLTRILQHMLTTRGYALQLQGGSTYMASRDTETLWFSGCCTAGDLVRPHKTLNRHRSLRRILRAHGVAQVVGRRVSDVAQLRSFVRRSDEMTLMIPNTGRFDDLSVRLLPPQAHVSEASFAGNGSWLIQEYPAGQRFTVIASRSRGVVIVGRRLSEQVSGEDILRLSDSAVDAVRAFPELRWAAVQVVVPQLDTEGKVLVEGMTTRPVFSRGDYLLAGSFGDFTDLVLEGARQYT